jgi:hypothetical protein
MCVGVSIEVIMKIGCLIANVRDRRFWLLCETCEANNRGYSDSLIYVFVNFNLDQFPEHFGQICFTCNRVLKEGQNLFDPRENYFVEQDLTLPKVRGR